MKLLVIYGQEFGRRFVERSIPLAKDLDANELTALQKILNARSRFAKRTIEIMEPQDVNGIADLIGKI